MVEAKHVYDQLDRDLISLLRHDGRAPLSKLADILKVSRGTVQNRLDRLVSRARCWVLPFACERIMNLMASGDHDDRGGWQVHLFRSFAGCAGWPSCIRCHTTNGSWDLVAEIQTASLSDFDRVLREVRLIEGVLNSETESAQHHLIF